MIALLCFFLSLFAAPFKSKSRLEAENAALRHQLIVLQRRVNSRRQIVVMDNLATHKVPGIKGGGGRWRRGALTVTPSREGQSL